MAGSLRCALCRLYFSRHPSTSFLVSHKLDLPCPVVSIPLLQFRLKPESRRRSQGTRSPRRRLNAQAVRARAWVQVATRGACAAAAPSPAPTTKLAKLRSIEESMQAIWASTHAFDSDAPVEASASSGSGGKFFVTFPFPYCNGRTHLYVNC